MQSLHSVMTDMCSMTHTDTHCTLTMTSSHTDTHCTLTMTSHTNLYHSIFQLGHYATYMSTFSPHRYEIRYVPQLHSLLHYHIPYTISCRLQYHSVRPPLLANSKMPVFVRCIGLHEDTVYMGVVTGRGVQLDISWHYCSSTEGMLVEGQTIQEWEESTHNINSWVCLGNPG